MRVTSLILATLLFSACSMRTGSVAGVTGNVHQSSTEDFDVTIVQSNAPMVMSDQTSVDVLFEITVRNRTRQPYTIERVTLESMGGGSYAVPLSSREYKRTIAPAATEALKFWATTNLEGAAINARVPLTIRATIEAANGEGEQRREVFTARLNGHVGLTASR